jgi:hypothetical protein
MSLENQKIRITSAAASSRFGVTNDYVTLLCRQKKIDGVLIGRDWFVDPESLAAFLKKTEAEKKNQREALAEKLRQEYKKSSQAITSAASAAQALARLPERFSTNAKLSIIASIVALVVMANVLGAISSSSEPTTAAVAQIESPFFGGTILSKFISSLFGSKHAEAPAAQPATPNYQTSAYPQTPAAAATGPIVQRVYQTVGEIGKESIPADVLMVMLGELHRSVKGEIKDMIGATLDLDFFTANSALSNVTDADIPDTITASNYLPLAGGTLTGALSGTNATFSGTASSTTLVISSLGVSAGQCLTTNSSGSVTATNCASAAGFAFTPTSYGNATSTTIGFTAGLLSTASSTFTSNLTLSSFSSASLAVNASGQVYAAATTTFAAPLVYSNGNVTVTQSGAATDGYLSSTDWNLFNNKVSSSSLATSLTSAFPFTQTTNYGALTNATSTALWFQDGIQASSTSHFANADFENATTSSLGIGTLTGVLHATNGSVTASAVLGQALGGTGLSSYAIGDILYADGGGNLAALPVGSNNQVLKISGGLPTWGADLTDGGGGSDANWTFFNGSGIYPSTTTNQVVIGGTSTTTLKYPLAKLGVIGGASIDSATTTNLYATRGLSNTLSIGATATTSISAAGVVTLASLSNSGLAVNSAGQVYAAATTTYSGVLAYSNGNVTVTQSGSATDGYLSSTDWNLFNSKVSSSSLASSITAAFPFTPTALGNSTSTLLQLTAGFISNASSTITALNAVNATTTTFAATLASTTNQIISSVAAALLKTTSGGVVSAAVAGTDYATPSQITSAFPFTPRTWGNSTSTTIGFTNGLISNASSTFTSSLNFTNFTNGSLAVNSSGGVYTAATTTYSGALTYSNGNVTCNTASGSQAGCLSSTDWTTFNNKISSSSLSQIYPFTPSTYNGTAVSATSTALQLTGGLYASSTVRFGNAGVSPFFYDGSVGNVGIGTTTPGSKLELYSAVGSTDITDMLKIETNRGDFGAPAGSAIVFKNQDSNNATNEARIKVLTENDGSLGINNEGSSSFVFSMTSAGTESDRVIFRGDGNVGIGTTSPYARLSVTNTGTGPSFVVEDTTSPDTTSFIIDADGNVSVGGALSASSLTLTTDLAVADGGTGASSLTDGGVLLGSGTGAITAMAVLGNGAIIVGDGTTDPVALTAFTSSTGDLIHEAGGLEADVSGYTNGLYGMLSSVTTDIDTESELETALGGLNIIESGDIDTYAELNAITSDVTLTHNGLIDTCAEIAALGALETGTCGSLVLSVSPTLTGTLTAATADFSGALTGTAGISSDNSVTAIAALAAGDLLAGNTSGTFQYDASGLIQYLQRSSADASAPQIIGRKSRNTTASPAVITTGDDLLYLRGYGYDGTSFVEGARITFDSEGTIGTGIVPGRLLFYTANSSGTLTQQLEIGSDGAAAFAGAITEAGSAVLSAANIDTCAEFIALVVSTGTCGSAVFSVSPTFTGTITAAAATLSSTLTANGTFDANGTVALGDGGDDIAINSNDWDISSAGAATGFTSVTAAGAISSTGASAGLFTEDRTLGTNTAFYASGGIGRFWNEVNGDIFTLSSGGEGTFDSVVNATAVNTGLGDFEVYAMNQHVRTTDSVDFAGLDITSAAWNWTGVVTNTNDRGTLCINTSSGNISADNNGNDCDTSSARYKKDIEYLELDGLEMVRQFKPVEFTRIRNDARERGFIAEDMAAIEPMLVWYDDEGRPNSLSEYAIIGAIADAVQELDLNLQALVASSTASSTPQAEEFAQSFWSGVFARVTSWLADAGNGIADLFATTVHAEVVEAKKVQTDELCVGSVCVTEEEFMALVQGGGSAGGQSSPQPEPEPPPAGGSDPEPQPEPTPEQAEEEPTPELTPEETPESESAPEETLEPEVMSEPEPIPEETPESEVAPTPEV